MRLDPRLLLLLLAVGCAPSLNNSDDDDLASDDDDLAADDDDAVADDDDDSTPWGDDDDATPTTRGAITFRATFGMCWGECISTLTLDPMFEEGWILTEGWEGETYTERWGSLSPNGVDTLLEVMDSVDPSDFNEVYGCPDCDDGGAREIIFEFGEPTTTAYEYGNPPAVLDELDDLLRAYEDEILTCNYGIWFWSIPGCDPVDGGGPVPG